MLKPTLRAFYPCSWQEERALKGIKIIPEKFQRFECLHDSVHGATDIGGSIRMKKAQSRN